MARGEGRHQTDNRGRPVEQLTYISGGIAAIAVNGVVVGRCEQGDFVGEVTALTGGQATGSAELFYNPTRKHTNNCKLSPVDYEARELKLNKPGV